MIKNKRTFNDFVCEYRGMVKPLVSFDAVKLTATSNVALRLSQVRATQISPKLKLDPFPLCSTSEGVSNL